MASNLDRTRPNVLAGSAGRQFSFGGKTKNEEGRATPGMDGDTRPRASPALNGENHDDAMKSPFTYALHVVFTSFVRSAEKKINTLAGTHLDPEPDVLSQLGPGADESFDKILRSLAFIARQDPKPVIDSVMFWRKSRAELRSDAQPAFNEHYNSQNKASNTSSDAMPRLQRRPTQPSRPAFIRSPSSQSMLTDASREASTIIADRKSLLSIFILCRTLIEIIKQLAESTLSDDVGEKLEEIVFNQLKNTDSDSIMASRLRHANWSLFAELLGGLSALRFASVSDRFIADLEKTGHGVLTRDKEARVEIVIRGMVHLQVRTFPVKHLEDSADFLSSLGRFFNDAHGARIKQAYADVLHEMISRVAAYGTAEFNVPVWVTMIAHIYPRATRMLEKARYWNVAYQLLCTLLCVSPRDAFLETWFSTVTLHLHRLRERANRRVFLESITRLIWVAIYRCKESSQPLQRKLDSLLPQIFPAARRTQHIGPSEIPALTQLARVICSRMPERYRNLILLPLLGKDLLERPQDMIYENIQPERITIALLSCLLIIHDLAKESEIPPYPLAYSTVLPLPVADRLEPAYSFIGPLQTPMLHYSIRVISLYAHHSSSSKGMDERVSNAARPSLAAFEANSHFTLNPQQQQWLECVVVAIGLVPHLIQSLDPTNAIIDLLFRLSSHNEQAVSNAASGALKILVNSRHGHEVINLLSLQIRLHNDSASRGQLSAAILRFYATLIDAWYKYLKSRNVGTNLSTPDPNTASDTKAESLLKIVDDVEACALFHLCAHAPDLRKTAIDLLRITSDIDRLLLQNPIPGSQVTLTSENIVAGMSNRIYDVLEDDGVHKYCQARLSTNEYDNVQKILKPRHTLYLTALAETEDVSLQNTWLKLFPSVVKCILKYCPIVAALSRNWLCDSVQKYQAKFEDATRAGRPLGPEGPRTGPLASKLDDQQLQRWHVQLMYVCSTLTHSDDPIQPCMRRHGYKRSISVAITGHVVSARSILKLILPLLTSPCNSVREAVTTSIACINEDLHDLLLELLRPMINVLNIKETVNITSPSSRLTTSHDSVILRSALCRILQETAKHVYRTDTAKGTTVALLHIDFIKESKMVLDQYHTDSGDMVKQLRCAFCVLLQTLWEQLRDAPQIESWLPLEGRVSCFRLLEEWSGLSHFVTAREIALSTNRNDHDANRGEVQSAANSSTSMELDQLHYIASETMASLCTGLVITKSMHGKPDSCILDHQAILNWIQVAINSSDSKIAETGQKALQNLTHTDLSSALLLNELVDFCYRSISSERFREHVYICLIDAVSSGKSVVPIQSRILCLALYFCGHASIKLRSKSVELFKHFRDDLVARFIGQLLNYSIFLYRKAQYRFSAHLTETHAQLAPFVVSEYCRIFKLIDDAGRPGLLRLLLPWLSTINLELDENGVDPKPVTYMTLMNLFELTLYKHLHCLDEVELMWLALGKGNNGQNSKLILDYLFAQCIARRDVLIVETAKQIVIYLNHGQASNLMVDSLLSHLEPRRMVPQLQEIIPVSLEDLDVPYCADLSILSSSHKRQVVFSQGQLAMIFLCALAVEPLPQISAQLPKLVLTTLLLLDHYIPIVQNEATEFLLYLSYNYTIRPYPETEQSIGMIAYLRTIRHNKPKFIWSYEDVVLDEKASTYGSACPAAMSEMLAKVLPPFFTCIPGMQNEIGALAMSWATSCPVRHIACRAFQIFRCINTSINHNMLADMLARLSNTICDPAVEIRNFALEIMKTIRHTIADLPPSELVNLPQLFWSTVACLDTTHEQEFLQALSTLELIIEKVDFSQPDCHSRYLSALPSRWETTFEGVFSHILKGVRSDTSMLRSLQLMDRLLVVPDCTLIGGRSRLLFGILAYLPIFVHSLTAQQKTDLDQGLLGAAKTISRVADNQDLPALSRAFDSFFRGKFRTADDFLRQITVLIRESYFPQWEGQSLVFLLGLLSHRQAWMKIATMEVLKAILPFVDTRRVEFVGVGADLISPLLRLLQTDFAQQALEVLDRALSISSGTRDRQVLRMSLGNRTIRKEYERTATLFGIPDESGWAVPMPAVTAARTRANVHAVFYTCAVTADEHNEIDNLQFQMEDYSYQPSSGRSATMVSERDADSTLGDMVSTLHNLDVFFTEDMDTHRKHKPKVSDPSQDQAPASIYDSRVAAILSRSLARTPSISSFTSPGFDTSPAKERLTPILGKQSSPVSNNFAFPRATSRSPMTPETMKSQAPDMLLSDSDVELDTDPVDPQLVDERSEASFRLETQLKKSTPASGVRAKLWSTKDPERHREKEQKKREKAALKEGSKHARAAHAKPHNQSSDLSIPPTSPGQAQPHSHSHSWFKREARHNDQA